MVNRTDSPTAGYWGRRLSRWRGRAGSLSWLRLSAVAAIGLDAVTTWHILVADSYHELNPLILAGWAVHPLVVASYFGGFGLCVWVITRRSGWLATAVATYVVLILGVFGGVNNLALFAFGPPSLLDLLANTLNLTAATLILSVLPFCGLCVALGVAGFRESPLS